MALLNRIMIFLVFAHTFLFFAGANGYIESYEGDNPHNAFLNETTSDDLQQSLLSENESSVVTENVGVGYTSLTFVQQIQGILFSPYQLASSAQLPEMLVILINTSLAIMKVVVIGGFLRGVLS